MRPCEGEERKGVLRGWDSPSQGRIRIFPPCFFYKTDSFSMVGFEKYQYGPSYGAIFFQGLLLLWLWLFGVLPPLDHHSLIFVWGFGGASKQALAEAAMAQEQRA